VCDRRQGCTGFMEVSMRRIVNSLFLVFLMAAPAAAQAVVTTPLDPSETYIPIIQFRSSEACFVDGFCITERTGISINSLATVNQLNAVSTRIDNLVTTLS